MTIISTNTTWSAGQTITLNDNVQIAPGVTLTIAAGATINGNGYSLSAFGNLDVNGTADNVANLNNLNIIFGSDYNNPGRVDIDHAAINGGALFPATGNAVYGSFSITNSIIKNAAASYIWYPTGDSVLSGNAFVNSGGLGIGTDYRATMHINDNVFVGSGAGYNGSASIVVWASYGNPVDVSGNTFLDADRPLLEVIYSGSKINAANNYFGTSDIATINNLILDRNDDLNRPSVIEIQPIATSPTDTAKAALMASGLSVILGTSNNDTLSGTSANDTIYAGSGNDYITDVGGSDILNGGDGDDTIFISRVDNGATEYLNINAGSGNDTITYQNYRAGAALIDLGSGDDKIKLWTAQSGGTTLTLGAGRDIVDFDTTLLYLSRGSIIVTDFAVGSGGDRLDLTNFLSDVLAGWDGSSNPFSAGYLKLVQSGSDTLVQIDRDGGGNFYVPSTLVTLQSTSADTLTSDNVGYNPFGGVAASLSLIGSPNADTLNGDTGADTIWGNAGNDWITGGAGNDFLYGGEGNDRFEGGPGNDVIKGGAGNDYISDSAGSDTLYGGDGDDTIFISRPDNGSTESVRIEAGNGDDTVTYQNYRSGSASIDLGAGNDRISLWGAQSGGTTVSLGAGQDTVVFEANFFTRTGSVTITDFTAGLGGDTFSLGSYALSGWDGTSNPFGSGYLRLVQAGTDTFVQADRDGPANTYAWSTLATLQSTSAHALIAENFGGWTPTVISAADAATAYVTAPSVIVEGADSTFSISITLKNLSIAGGTVSVSLLPSSTATSDDVSVPSFTQSYSVYQSPARDYVITAPTASVFDDLVSEPGKTIDIEIKATGQLFDTGTDTKILHIALVDGDQIGTNGADELTGTLGKDLLQGGLGDDAYHVNNPGDVISEGVNEGIDTVYSTIGYTLGANLENLVLQGSSAINGSGNDLANALTGNAANNILSGNAGNDRIATGGGRDIIDGGAGSDTLVLTGARASYAVFTINGESYLIGNGEGVRVSNIETVQFANETASWASVLQSAEPFDVARYLATHPDLAGLGADPQAAASHFANFGFLEGRAAGSFDALEYIASNTDLIAALGPDAQAAMNHYVGFGIAEGRATASFDALGYIASNIDLIPAFGTDTDAAERHYITNGFSEGRQTDSFDALEYVASNTDLIRAFGTDSDAAARHYITNGFGEGRQTDSFDALEYVASNTDLIRAFGTDADAAERHYITNGFSEGRQINSFDALEYVASNTDLIRAFGTDTGAAERHYISYGFSEGRQIDSFDALEYIASNTDLIRAFGTDADAAERHYISYGFSEGRQPDSFDALEYVASNADLIHAFGTDTEAATRHYITNGFGEGRQTDSFDIAAYQAAHPSLAGLSHDAVLTQYISTMSFAPTDLYMA